MSRLDPDEVREIALLARLALGEDEIARMTQDLDAILGYVEALRALDTQTTEPMTHAVPFDCPLRPDVQADPLSVDDALRNAPRREAGFFQVPRILPLPSATPSPSSAPGVPSPAGGGAGGNTASKTGGKTGGTPGDS